VSVLGGTEPPSYEECHFCPPPPDYCSTGHTILDECGCCQVCPKAENAPAVLGNDSQCRRCCNLESTVVESTLILVQCEKNGVDCPDEQNTVVNYLPEYMQCLNKRNRRAVSDFEPSSENYCVAGHCAVTSKREGRGLQWIMFMLPSGVTNALGMGGDDGGDDGERSDVSCSSCGVSPQRSRPRIVGGLPAPKNAYPWLVALVLKGTIEPFCAGTLLSSRTVLTAAHCNPYRLFTGFFQVHVGEHDVRIADGEQIIDVSSWESHPEFDFPDFDFDFAIITLASDVVFSDTVMPACLPDASTDYDSVVATVAGWGDLTDPIWGALITGGDSPFIPHSVEVDTITNTACSTDTLYATDEITDNMICARRPGKDSCKWDSGGPLVTKEGNTYTLIGIVSFGEGCANDRAPGVYSRVTQQLPWIRGRIQGTCPEE